MKRIAISLAMVAVLAGAGPSLAHGNMCDGRIDTNCHRSHDQYGYATDRCDVYINLGEPTNDYCIGTYL